MTANLIPAGALHRARLARGGGSILLGSAALRRCLICSFDFPSVGAHHRVCGGCRVDLAGVNWESAS